MAAACNPPQWLFPLLHILEGQVRCPIDQPHRMTNMVNISVNLGRTKVKVTSIHPICIHRIQAELEIVNDIITSTANEPLAV